MEELEKLLLETGKSKTKESVYLWVAFEVVLDYGKIPMGLYDKVAALVGTSYEAARKGISRALLKIWKLRFPDRNPGEVTGDMLQTLVGSLLGDRYIM